MAVTVEELQIVVVANVKNAMAQMTQLNRQIKKTMTDAVKPVKQVTESAQKSASVIAKAQAQITEANARTQVAQDKMRASAAKTQAAIEKASAASAKAQESLRKSTEAANAAMERQRKATARVKQTREELAKIVDRALRPQTNNDMVESDGPLYPPKTYTDAYAPKKAAQPQQPRAPGAESLTVWQRVTAQINAKLDALKEKLHKVGLYGKDAGEKTGKALKKVRDPAENAARAVKKVGDSARQSGAHAGYLGRMLKSMAVSMLFFQGIAMVTNAVRDGIQNIAQGSTRANAVLSSLASSFLYLKNSVAAAFMPALQALAPVIATITNALASLLNMIGAVTARLFGGATTFVKAKKVQTDYAASISKTGQAAKKAAKDAQGALASFDELNVIGQENAADEGSAGDAAGGVAQPADMFETVAIPPEALSFADKVAGMFDRLKTAAEPTIEAFGRLKTAMQPLKEFTFTALTDFYKDFLVPVGKWTLGEGLPRFIDALSNGLGKVNWGNINAALKTLWEALTPFTIHVGEGLLWFWENALVPLGTWTMNEIVPRFLLLLAAALDVLNSAIAALKPAWDQFWETILKPIAQWTGGVIVSVLDGIIQGLRKLSDWIKENQSAVQEFGTILLSVITGIIVMFSAGKFVAAVQTAITWFQNLLSVLRSAQAIATVVGAAMGGISAPAVAAVAAIGAVAAVIIYLWQTSKDFRNAVTDAAKAMGAVLSNLWQTVIKPLFETLATNLQWIWTEHLQPLLGNIVAFVDKLIQLAATIIANVVMPIVNILIDRLGPTFTTVFNTIQNIVSSVIAAVIDVISGLVATLNGILQYLIGVFSGDWEKAWEGIVFAFQGVFGTMGGIVKGVVNVVISLINGMIEAVENGLNWIIGKVNSLTGALSIVVDIPEIPTVEFPRIPRLASGGVLSGETLFVGGEYAGASSNPEIVSPQSIMLETFKEAVWPLVDAILEGDEKVRSAIEAKDTNMYVDGYKMNRTLAAHDSRVSKQKGASLIL